jgi:hypothetical protein
MAKASRANPMIVSIVLVYRSVNFDLRISGKMRTAVSLPIALGRNPVDRPLTFLPLGSSYRLDPYQMMLIP